MDPSFSLADLLLEGTYFVLQLLDDVLVVALLKVKLAYPDFVVADFVLVLSDLVFFVAYLRCQLVVLFA